MEKKGKNIKFTKTKKIEFQKPKQKKIVEYYYMIPCKTNAKEISLCIKAVDEEKVEVWTELNLLEVVMDSDSLIFQDAKECFIDPLDLEFLEENHIETMYQISFEVQDLPLVRKVMKEIMEAKGGMICSDTDDFEPIYTKENVNKL